MISFKFKYEFMSPDVAFGQMWPVWVSGLQREVWQTTRRADRVRLGFLLKFCRGEIKPVAVMMTVT